MATLGYTLSPLTQKDQGLPSFTGVGQPPAQRYSAMVAPSQPSASIKPQGQVLGAAIGPGGGGAAAPTGQNLGLSDVLQQAPQQGGIDFDALIAPALQGLDSAIGMHQQNYQDTLGDIDRSRQTQIDSTNQSLTGQYQTLDSAKTSAQQGGESAANEARRQYSEIQQGLQARYGGTTGTGAFASDMAGRQTLQNIGKVRQAVSTALVDLDNKHQQVQEIGRIALADIEDKTLAQKNDAKSQLENALASIRQQKGELQARKAEMAMQAMQHYQDTVNQVNANNTAFKQQLYQQQQAAEQQLKSAMARASSVTDSYTPQDLASMVQQSSPLVNAGFSPTYSGKLKGGGQFSVSPTKVNKDEEDDNNY